MLEIKYKREHPEAKHPFKKYDNDFCFDVVATEREFLAEGIIKYNLGVSVEINRKSLPWYIRLLLKWNILKLSIDLRPRSSVWKTGLVLSNCTGTVDEDYRGQISVVFYKVAEGTIYEVGDRVCQAKIGLTLNARWIESTLLSNSDRGANGYGSTGR